MAHGKHPLGYVWLRVKDRNTLARALVYDWQEHDDIRCCMCVLAFTEPCFNDDRNKRILSHEALNHCLNHWGSGTKDKK